MVDVTVLGVMGMAVTVTGAQGQVHSDRCDDPRCDDLFFSFLSAGEYHLDLIVDNGAVPIIVPRVTGIAEAIDSFEPIHGVLLCEGEDVSPSLYESDTSALSQEDIATMKKAHVSDVAIDSAKDSIELALARRCLERSIPFLGICRGSQILNIATGGTLFQVLYDSVSYHEVLYDAVFVLCLERSIPFAGVCRGSQILNIAPWEHCWYMNCDSTVHRRGGC